MIIDINTPELYGKYGVIYADPPWNFKTRSAKGRGRCPDGQGHYPVMRIEDIHAMGDKVKSLAADNCVLLMWVTDPLLPEGLEVMKSWGFEYKTVGFYWAKRGKRAAWPFGGGYWTRSNPEQCLLGVRGAPKRLNADVRRLVVSPRREHSRKPDEMYRYIERLVAGPYLELFSRTDRYGWDCWGLDVGKFGSAD